jgi:hypothetical protein
LEGSCHGLITILSWNLPGWIEENINQDSQYPDEDENQAPPKYTVMPVCLVLVSETY